MNGSFSWWSQLDLIHQFILVGLGVMLALCTLGMLLAGLMTLVRGRQERKDNHQERKDNHYDREEDW